MDTKRDKRLGGGRFWHLKKKRIVWVTLKSGEKGEHSIEKRNRIFTLTLFPAFFCVMRGGAGGIEVRHQKIRNTFEDNRSLNGTMGGRT